MEDNKISQDDKQTLLNNILSLLNTLSENEKIVIDREFLHMGKLQNGKVKLTKKLRPVFESIESIPYLQSTSIAKSPAIQPIKKFSKFGDDSPNLAKKRRLKREQDKDKAQEALVGTAEFLISEDSHPIVQRHCGTHHHYKVIKSHKGAEIWIEIESKIKDDMVIKTGAVNFVRLGTDEKLIKIEPKYGTFMGRVNL